MSRAQGKQGLRPIQDVVWRLRYDAAFDASRFVVGYEERFAGGRETPLLDFLGASEIPWHRIVYLKVGDLVVWDRKLRIDLVFGSGESGAPRHEDIARASAPAPAAPQAPAQERGRRAGARPSATEAREFVPQPSFRFDAARGAWSPALPTGLVEADAPALTVSTYNVLFDLYEADKIYSEARREVCLELLRAQDADLVALQEVTPALWAMLLAQPWVRERYYVSSGPGAEGLVPYGPALLSRWPLALELHSFSSQKRLLVGRLSLAGRALLVASVHLTSNYRGDADERRAEQIEVLLARLRQGDVADALILGDFNFGDEDENDQLPAAGLLDAWTAVHPHHPGFTFDPVANPLAAIMSRTGRAARFDRVLLHSPARAVAPVDVAVFGDKPFAAVPGGLGKFASDHFGLTALLQTAPPATPKAIDAAPVHTSALVVIPPERHWRAIQAVRREHDPAYARWMPHVNLIYGFVPEEDFAAAAEAVAAATREIEPFELTFEGLGRFDHRASTTLWLRPKSAPDGRLEALQAALAPAFPRCDEQSGRSADGFTPHLTVAKLTGPPGQLAATAARLAPTLPPFTCRVEEVHLISRRGDDPFEIRYTVKLGGHGVVRASEAATPPPAAETPRPWPLAPLPPWGVWASPRHEAAARTIADACAAELGAAAQVHLVGSARLGVAGPESDLDLVCSGPAEQDRDALFAGLCERLARTGSLRARPAASAGLPVLRGLFEGISFDLQFAGLPPALLGRPLDGLGPAELACLADADRRAALGCVDADALVRLSGAGAAAFTGALRTVRRWARARQLDAGAWGLLGGYTWALLVTHAAREAVLAGMSAEPWTLVRAFFATFAEWPRGRPVALGPLPAEKLTRRTQWPIYTPTPPAFNSARNLTSATLTLVAAELRRGHEVARSASREEDAAALFEPVRPTSHPRALALELRADPEDLPLATGALEGHAVGLLIALEEQGARVRPFPRGERGDSALRATIAVEGGESARLLGAAQRVARELTSSLAWPASATLEITWARARDAAK